MSELTQRSGSPYWLIVRESARKGEGLEILSLDSGGVRRLPLFYSGESAERFRLRVPGAEGEWRARATGAGELISLLSGSAFAAGPCAGVERVLLDPPPEALDRSVREGELDESLTGESLTGESLTGESLTGESLTGESLTGESRGCFLERLMGRGRPWFETKDRKESK